MSVIDKFIRDARKTVTTAEIFLSSFMLEIFTTKIRYICREYRVHMPRLHVIFDPRDDALTAKTNLEEMHVNAGHPIFDGDNEDRFLKVAGVLLHELGHILFTNFTAWFAWQDSMSHGVYYPRTPDVDPAFEEKRDILLGLATSDVYGEAFFILCHSINNGLEDGREEGFILRLIKNARFMIKGLIKVRQDFYAEDPSFEEIAANVDSGKWPVTMAIDQLILHYARFKEVKGKFDPKSELGAIFCEMIPYIDVYLNEKKAVICYDAFNKILICMADIIEREFNAMSKKAQQKATQGQQGQQSQQSQQSSSSGNSSGTQTQGQSPTTTGAGNNQKGKSQSDNGAGNKMGTESSKSASADTGSGEQSSGQQPSEKTEPLSEQEKADIKSAIENALNDLLDQLIGTTVDNSSSMGDKAKGSDRSTVGRRLSGLTDGSEGGIEKTAQGAEKAQGSGTVTHEVASDDTNINLTLDDIARKIAGAKAEEAMSDAVRCEYKSVANEVKDWSEIHRDCDITMYHYSQANAKDIEEYNSIARVISPLVKKAVKSSNFYKKDRESYYEDNLYFGQKLHADQAYRGDGRIFSKRFDRDEPPQVALAVRIDNSGSMSGERIKAAQRTCVFLYEYVLGMEKRYNVKIPLYIYGDCVNRDAHGVNMYVFADDKYRTSTEKYRIMKMASGGCNRDGMALRMAVKRLESEHPYHQKVLFNITDGKPNDHSYGGEEAHKDLRDLTKYCERHRIALASCAIGSDRDIIEEIYGSNHFLDISDLNELPIRLVKILKKLLK